MIVITRRVIYVRRINSNTIANVELYAFGTPVAVQRSNVIIPDMIPRTINKKKK